MSMTGWVDIGINEDGTKTVFSTEMIGIVDDIGLPCPSTPRQIYLRDCSSLSD